MINGGCLGSQRIDTLVRLGEGDNRISWALWKGIVLISKEEHLETVVLSFSIEEDTAD